MKHGVFDEQLARTGCLKIDNVVIKGVMEDVKMSHGAPKPLQNRSLGG